MIHSNNILYIILLYNITIYYNMGINKNLFLKSIFNELFTIRKIINKFIIERIENKLYINNNIFSKNFIPENIKNYIIENKNINSIKLKLHIDNIDIHIIFHNFNNKYILDNFINSNIDKIKILFLFIMKYNGNSCLKNMKVNIFLTNFKKKLPKNNNDIISINNVNSGYSTIGCNSETEIIIYRKEEWFKVLIHELFHNLNFDFSTYNIERSKKLLQENFGVKSEYKFFETYCETFSRILNVLIISFLKSSKNDSYNIHYNNFYKYFNNSIKLERIHSLKQANKILKLFDNFKEYREDSEVFCYYVLTACLINDYESFITWCINNNNNILKFNIQNNNIYNFASLIINECINKNFNKILNYNEKKDDTVTYMSLRMTII